MSALKARELMNTISSDIEPAEAQVITLMALSEAVLEVAHSLNNIMEAIDRVSN